MTSAAPRQTGHATTTSRAAIGSQTLTEPNRQPQTQPGAILRLRGAHPSRGRSVQWREDVVDNEGLGRKKSKVCCIYHRPKAVDESSDDSSSSSSGPSDSDSDAETSRARCKERSGSPSLSAAGDRAKEAQEHGGNGHNETCQHGRGRKRRPGCSLMHSVNGRHSTYIDVTSSVLCSEHLRPTMNLW
ncbi:hypothetical protein P8C59_005323 [Phyllachora maydis]|uniref:Type 1 phosphatases regulator n=1 Tax=Phyllachora maydis TaxID=1825666 RepID=A0AAD9MFD8_9PEZI|nr:hypothetical protein P8C59_005323 [Phyllachora maydis]